MTSSELRKFWHRSPFVPFDLVIPGRMKFHVPHSDFLSVSPNGRIAHIWTRGDDYAAVDIFLVTALEKNSKTAKRKRIE